MSTLQISRIFHAGYIFKFNSTQIIVDPIFENPFSVNCFAHPPLTLHLDAVKKLRFDAVFISHFHDDHCSLESLQHIDRATPFYIYCVHTEIETILRQMGFQRIYFLKVDHPIAIKDLTITPRRALEEDVDSLLHIQAADLHVLNVVDAWIDDDTLKNLTLQTTWDLVLWPFQNLREIEVLSPRRFGTNRYADDERLAQLSSLAPRFVVPSSCQFIQEEWSWLRSYFFSTNYDEFIEKATPRLKSSQIVQMPPGSCFELSRQGFTELADLPWIQRLSEDGNYRFDATAEIPSTSAIAKKFKVLDVSQLQSVAEYCRHHLLTSYSSLDSQTAEFFAISRIWELRLWDHDGLSQSYFYSIEQDRILGIEKTEGVPQWLTEIPVQKLYGALENGETLTSLYVRINDTVFDAETEHELKTADLMEDPLLRCLFSRDPLLYQKAQLRRLLNSE